MEGIMAGGMADMKDRRASSRCMGLEDQDHSAGVHLARIHLENTHLANTHYIHHTRLVSIVACIQCIAEQKDRLFLSTRAGQRGLPSETEKESMNSLKEADRCIDHSVREAAIATTTRIIREYKKTIRS